MAGLAVATLAGFCGFGLCGEMASAQTPAPAPPIEITYLGLTVERVLPLSYLDQPPTDDGIQGARLALGDNQTTGQFLGQSYHLNEAMAADPAGAIDAFKKQVAAGQRLFVTDLPAPLLLQVADLPEAKGVTLLDATTRDDTLRGESCRRNVLHTSPSRAMLADALMQYLVIKKWGNIALVIGGDPADKDYADAVRNSARKFRIKIVQEIPWTFDPGSRRTDTGHYAVQAEVARITQGVRDYDLLVVADEADNFGDELSYRTTSPRPIAGSQGLVPSAWARPFEQWGATQLQSRFLKQANRWMTDNDYGAWLAVRAVGEAATRGNTSDPAKIAEFMRSKDFDLAGFKGTKLTFRDWDGQLREPILLADARSLVSVSPQPGFLHQFSELDTLGVDRPETKCHMQ
ncbi:MAG: branched-chain amino acid transporter substrate-binding protein [Rhodospirillales bacterium]|nr:branched-chain amino acid transporter substrate-binding protein [Rhodospirillales bacterium]